MFKNLFGRGKKEVEVDHTVRNLDQGYLFEYDMRTWEVKAVYEYDWGQEHFTKEYQVSDGREKRYLTVSDEEELELVWSQKIKPRAILKDLPNIIVKNNAPPESLAYQNQHYYLEEESAGYFKDLSNSNSEWEEFMAWDYEDEAGELTITIERWDEREFEASQGRFLKEFEISNILPREKK